MSLVLCVCVCVRAWELARSEGNSIESASIRYFTLNKFKFHSVAAPFKMSMISSAQQFITKSNHNLIIILPKKT